ncbi:hypothetical protein [Klebsiella michiganensis]|uniref:tail fiber/spike domain-containing protein n=2 Tax=Klebsiella michiganensis TaxID=1134687 RepID=UPI002499FCB3|nr:hypothetical protein [Klebsiella michiganensis]MDI3222453.1 hypothetical protein [Klebsiella michiganensis]
MMVENDTSSVEYQLSTSTGPFDIPFYFIENGHIVAELYTQNGDDFNKTTLTVDVDYYLNGAGDKDGGQLTLLSAHSGATLLIYRDPDATQLTSYQATGKFPATSHERALDKLTMLIQKFGWWWDTLALKKPNIFANYYDALNNRIRNLRDPSQAQDAATKNYVDSADNGLQQKIDSNFKRSLRVPDSSINQLPSADDRAWKGLGFDGAGQPKLQDPAGTGLWGYVPAIGSFEKGSLLTQRFEVLLWESTDEYWRWDGAMPKIVLPGSTPDTAGGRGKGKWLDVTDATLRSNLGSSEPGMGASLIALIYGGTVQDAIKFVTPYMYQSLVSDGNWSAAIVAADAKAAELGLPLMGFGQVFSVRSLALISDHIEGVGFTPADGYTGAGPTFKINQVTGNLYFKGSCKGFTSVGAKFIRGNYSGIPQLTLDACEFSNNGSLLRTTCVNAVNTASDFVIPVVDASGFIVGNYIWIGDSKCMIAGISGNTITLVNNGSAPTLYSGGTGTGSYKAGQFFTRDGDGKNGATIGEGGTEAGWGLTIQNGIKLMNNGWFGLFHYVRAKGGTVSIKGKVEGGNNGYCAMGLAYVQGGEISGFTFYENGNNGLDIFETTGDLSISDGLCYGNGVDGIFACGNGTGPKITRVKSRNNFRIGILAYGRTASPTGFNIIDCECTDNGLYDVCYTGVRSLNFAANTIGGASTALKIEGRNGLLNPDGVTVSENNFAKESSIEDINANIGGYNDGGSSGAISVLNNRYNGRNQKHTISNFNRSQSRFVPVGRLSFTSSYTAAAGATISVPLVFYKPNATSNIDVLGGQVEIQICSNPSLLTIGTVTSALRTAGIELSNSATTNGKILAMAAFGTLSYNFTLRTAGTVYLNVRSPYGDGVIQLTWT